jgi:hypothetical protein
MQNTHLTIFLFIGRGELIYMPVSPPIRIKLTRLAEYETVRHLFVFLLVLSVQGATDERIGLWNGLRFGF